MPLAIYAGVAQLVEQLICNQQVAGSSPIQVAIISLSMHRIDCASVAQSVEQRTENPRVVGSIPTLGTRLYRDCITASRFFLF